MKHCFLMGMSMIFFVSCTQQQPYIEISQQENSPTFHDKVSENTYVAEEMSNTREKTLERVSTPIERIPNFQEKDFKAIITNNRKNVKKELEVSGGNVKVNVESIPLNEFVDFIFSSVLKMNYTVDKSVKTMKQPITLNMAKPLPTKQVLAVVKNILKQESVGLSQKDEILFISPSSKRQTSQGLSDRYMIVGRELSSSLKDDQKVLIFVPIDYLKPKEVALFINRLGRNKVKMNFLSENILTLSGEAFDINQVLELIKIVDSPSMDKKIPYVLNLEYITVEKFTERMKEILQSNAVPIAKNIREVGVVLTPIKEINSLLILSSKESWIEMLTFWKNKLDVLSEVDTEHNQLYSYKVKYRKADDLASILSEVLTLEKSNIINSTENNETHLTQSNNQTNNRSSVNIKSDSYTNTLMLNVTPAEYKRLLPIIQKLDILALQVVVEVTFAQVKMHDDFKLGFEWGLLNNKGISGIPTKASGAYSLALGKNGLLSSLFTTNLTSIIDALASKNKLEILSRPRLLILNNKTGNLNIGEEVPVLSSEVSASGGQNLNPVQNISYMSTGTILNITPTINSNGSLTMEISITLSDSKLTTSSSIKSPTISNVSLTTSAVMQSGSSLLLGGFISQSNTRGHSGVPLLQDIPLIGTIFKGQGNTNDKTELIVLIKPKILKNNLDADKETKKFQLLIKNLNKSITL